MAQGEHLSKDGVRLKDPLIRPSGNREVMVWLALFGLPILVLFFILAETQERAYQQPQPASGIHQPHH